MVPLILHFNKMPLKPFNAGDTDCLSLLSAIGSKVICASLLAMRSHQTRTLFEHFKKHRLYHSHIYYQDKYITKIFFCQYFYIILYIFIREKAQSTFLCGLGHVADDEFAVSASADYISRLGFDVDFLCLLIIIIHKAALDEILRLLS